jgi:hypothetical protein
MIARKTNRIVAVLNGCKRDCGSHGDNLRCKEAGISVKESIKLERVKMLSVFLPESAAPSKK